MSTSVQAFSIEKVKQALIEELRSCSNMTGRITNRDVIASYQNVVCIELRSSIALLPGALKSRYDLAVAAPDAANVDLQSVITAINRVSG